MINGLIVAVSASGNKNAPATEIIQSISAYVSRLAVKLEKRDRLVTLIP
ncbi:hypothetical protein PMAG_a0557 [Pseudoalteromonas mariniglutinosa NCIMB 1770]|nr:hypothetical protein [Pseudoalteromonas mariniglutinosa NCIMB 1770]